MERVSVIIPTYNSAHLVVDAIDSALAQTIAPSQIIVVDDGSTDDTQSRLQSYGNRITIIHQTNQGVPAARNAAMRVATGDWIALLDADDAWHPRKLELQLAAARANPQIVLLGTQLLDYPRVQFPPVEDHGDIQPIPLEYLVLRNHFAASSALIRRSIARQIGEFDPALPGAEDLDFWLRAAELGEVAILNLPLTGYRTVPGSLSRRAAGMETVILRILRKLDDRDAWHGRRLLRRRAISQIYWSCANLYSAAGRPATALWRLAKSFAWYPLPYARRDTNVPLARPRRVIVLLARALHLLPPEQAGGAL